MSERYHSHVNLNKKQELLDVLRNDIFEAMKGDAPDQIEEIDQETGDVVDFKAIDYTHITELSNKLALKIEEYMDKRHLYSTHGYDMTEMGTNSNQIRT